MTFDKSFVIWMIQKYLYCQYGEKLVMIMMLAVTIYWAPTRCQVHAPPFINNIFLNIYNNIYIVNIIVILILHMK